MLVWYMRNKHVVQHLKSTTLLWVNLVKLLIASGNGKAICIANVTCVYEVKSN